MVKKLLFRVKYLKRICIIGGGIVGSSIAYHLGFEDGVKTVLYEKGTLGIGTTSKSAATFQIHYSEDWERKFYRYGWKLYQKWSKDPKSSVDFKKTGCLILAETDEMVYEQVEKPAEFMKSRGEETHILDSTASAEYLPSLDSQYIKKSISIPKAGYIDPYQIIREFKKSAKENGVEINTQTEVTDLIVKK